MQCSAQANSLKLYAYFGECAITMQFLLVYEHKRAHIWTSIRCHVNGPGPRMFVEQSRMFVCACPEQGKLSMIAFKCNLAARSVPRHMMHDERVCLRACEWMWMPLDGYVVGKVVEVDDVKLVSLSASSLCWFIYRKTTRAFLRPRIRAQWHWDFFV